MKTSSSASGQEIRISGDSHLSEPPDLWEKNLPAKYRDRAPRFPRIKIGTGVFVVEGRGATSFWQLGTDKQTVEWPWAS